MKRTITDFWDNGRVKSRRNIDSVSTTTGSSTVSEYALSSYLVPRKDDHSDLLATLDNNVDDIAKNKDGPTIQPNFQFPTTMFGLYNRSFQGRWYTEHKWLEYSKKKDAAFCFPCRLFSTSAEIAFTKVGFRDWKHACGKDGILNCHAKSIMHMNAMLNWEEYQKGTETGTTISMQLDRMGQQVIVENRKYILSIMEAILYCAQQGIPLRGHEEHDDASNPGNFTCLIKLLSRHSSTLRDGLKDPTKNATWMSPSIQNEIIHFLADSVRQRIAEELREARYFTILADESKYFSKKEQLSIAFRYLYRSRTVERFTGYTHVSEMNAVALAEYIFQKISEFNLDLSMCASQCYDIASVMSGCNAGVQVLIQERCKQAVYVHCCAHRLNLVLVDVVKGIPAANDFFSLLQAVYVFLASSKTHDVFLENQKSTGQKREITLKKLSDTRWSCRYDSIAAIWATFPAILATLYQLIVGHDRSRAIEASGIQIGLKKFSFIICLVLFKKLFSISSKLSDLLQAESLDLGCASIVIQATIDTFVDMKCEFQWQLLWEEAEAFARKNDIDIVEVKSKRLSILPAKLQDSVITPETTGKRVIALNDYRMHVYYKTVDAFVSEMRKRFSNLNFELFRAIDTLRPNSPQFLNIDVLTPFLNHYNIDLEEIKNESMIFGNYVAIHQVNGKLNS